MFRNVTLGSGASLWNLRRVAFSNVSLIEIWPKLHRVPLVWVALVSNVLLSLGSLYFAMMLDRQSDPAGFALVIIAMAGLLGIAGIINRGLIDWICIIEEHTTRKNLFILRTPKNSISNTDLPISVSIIAFYIAFPGLVLSALVYLVYLILQSPMALLPLTFVVAIASYPLILFARWRKRVILDIRNSRNQLIDNHLENMDRQQYSGYIEGYASHRMEFFWNNKFAWILLQGGTFLVLYLTLVVARNTEHAFSITAAMGLLIQRAHAIYNSICDFQEDKYSMNRVRAALSNPAAAKEHEGSAVAHNSE